MSELQRCPFCGSPHVRFTVETSGGHGGGPRSWFIQCKNCWARGPLADQQLDYDEVAKAVRADDALGALAINRWNVRSSSPEEEAPRG